MVYPSTVWPQGAHIWQRFFPIWRSSSCTSPGWWVYWWIWETHRWGHNQAIWHRILFRGCTCWYTAEGWLPPSRAKQPVPPPELRPSRSGSAIRRYTCKSCPSSAESLPGYPVPESTNCHQPRSAAPCLDPAILYRGQRYPPVFEPHPATSPPFCDPFEQPWFRLRLPPMFYPPRPCRQKR